MKTSPLIILALLLTGCMPPNQDSDPQPNQGGGDATIYDEKFVETDGEYRVYFNDASQVGPNGITLIKAFESEVTLGSWSVQVRKEKGHELGWYGVVFNRQDAQNFWYVFIDINQYYTLGKVVDGTIEELHDPNSVFFASLLSGYGQTNKITLTYNTGTSDYTVSFNDEPAETFQTGETGNWSSGKLGFSANVTNLESFPSVPVETYYESLDNLPLFSQSFSYSSRALGGRP